MFVPLPPDEIEEKEAGIKVTDDGMNVSYVQVSGGTAGRSEAQELLDESPIDIATATSPIPLPDDNDENLDSLPPQRREKRTHMRHLCNVAQQAESGLKTMSPIMVLEKVSVPAVSLPKV